MVGRIPGSVICQTFWKRFAPSIWAASYSPGSMPAMEDKYMMALHPISFQHSMTTITSQIRGELVLIRCRFVPTRESTTPPSLKMFFAILAMITHDTKWGR